MKSKSPNFMFVGGALLLLLVFSVPKPAHAQDLCKAVSKVEKLLAVSGQKTTDRISIPTDANGFAGWLNSMKVFGTDWADRVSLEADLTAAGFMPAIERPIGFVRWNKTGPTGLNGSKPPCPPPPPPASSMNLLPPTPAPIGTGLSAFAVLAAAILLLGGGTVLRRA